MTWATVGVVIIVVCMFATAWLIFYVERHREDDE